MPKRKLASRRANPEARMSLMEHIRELRIRLLRALLGLSAGMIVGFITFKPVWAFLQRPYCRLPQAHRLSGGRECNLVVNGIFDSFFLQLKIAFIIGAVVSSPVWLYQLWAFVAPGLHRRERRWTYVFMLTAVPLFAGGAVLAYLTLDKGLGLLLGFTPNGVVPLITITSYLGYAVAMLLIFGATFELPLFIVVLNFAGILTHERIGKWRRGIIFGIFVFAAVATPSQDPFTMLALALPTVVLFEAAELVAFLHDRRQARQAAASPYAGLADDETSPLDLDTGYGIESQTRAG